MKRVLIILVSLLLSLSCLAQGWDKIDHPADELMKVQAHTSYLYTDDLGNSFVY